MDLAVKLSSETGGDFVDAGAYGRLMYLQIIRPDITFAVHKLSQFSPAPRESHLKALLKVLLYIKVTHGQGLFYCFKAEMQIQEFAYAY